MKKLQKKSWVFEADTIFDKYGNRSQMDPTINFVSPNNNESILQFGFNGYTGYNGVGAVTYERKDRHYDVIRDENSILIKFTAMGAYTGSVDLVACISSDGSGRITVGGNWGQRFSFAGYFVPHDNSLTFMGTPFL